MKTIALSLVALATLTGVALANDRTEEGTVASRNVYNGAVWANMPIDNGYGNVDSQAFAVPQSDDEGVSDYALKVRQGFSFGSDQFRMR